MFNDNSLWGHIKDLLIMFLIGAFLFELIYLYATH